MIKNSRLQVFRVNSCPETLWDIHRKTTWSKSFFIVKLKVCVANFTTKEIPITCMFLWMLKIFLEILFIRISLNDIFWILMIRACFEYCTLPLKCLYIWSFLYFQYLVLFNFDQKYFLSLSLTFRLVWL